MPGLREVMQNQSPSEAQSFFRSVSMRETESTKSPMRTKTRRADNSILGDPDTISFHRCAGGLGAMTDSGILHGAAEMAMNETDLWPNAMREAMFQSNPSLFTSVYSASLSLSCDSISRVA